MLDLKQGRELATDGASKAAAHAERVAPGWNQQASTALARYGAALGEFMTEDVRGLAVEVPDPPDVRAWGAVIKDAKKAGLIRFERYAAQKATNCHGSLKAVWKWVGGAE
jgi:hypothetical protein